MNNDLISREALKKAIIEPLDVNDVCKNDWYEGYYTAKNEDVMAIDNAPTVEVPENEVNCVLTMFGECSYNKTGCSDCEIKVKIRKALKDVERLEEENHSNFVNSQHIISMLVEEIKKLRGDEE